ncbi:helicase HerA-like domain-containing protein [Sporolactobacillus shoreae]|nr:helicase HerA-like domain-containing protein [Sporolactobacillus shoreae]
MLAILKRHFHTVKYQFSITLLEKVMLTIGFVGILIIMRETQSFSYKYLSLQYPNYVYTSIMSIALAMWFWTYYSSKFSFSKVRRIKAKLLQVIKTNDFYISEVKRRHKRIISSLKFVFYYKGRFLIVETYSAGARYTKSANDLGEILESALGLPLEDKNEQSPEKTAYKLTIKKPERIHLYNPSDLTDKHYKILLDEFKAWDFVKNPHAIICGATGSGKTTMVYEMMLFFAHQGADLFIADPKRSDLSGLKYWIPNSDSSVVNTPGQIAKMTSRLVNLMNDRYENFFSSKHGKRGQNYISYNLRPIVLIFDEIASFMAMDKKIAKEVEDHLKQIIMMGRQAGIYVILSTQKPMAEAVPTAIRDQMGLRIALGKMSKSGYHMTLGDDWDSLPSAEVGTGKGYIYIDGLNWSNPHPFEAPYIDMDSINYEETLAHFLQLGEQQFAQEEYKN